LHPPDPESPPHDRPGSPILSLVADIGGTNTRVALARGAEVDASSVERYRNAEHDGLASVIAAYLEKHGISDAEIGGVCVAGAGPVRDGVVQLTNLDWRIDRTRWPAC
jgi:glucokinase